MLRWWQQKRDQLLQVAAQNSPAYVYDQKTIESRAQSLLDDIPSVDHFYYATKANHHESLLGLLIESGFGLECVSIGELRFAVGASQRLGKAPKSPYLFTPNFAPREEYEEAFRIGALVTVDNTYPLKHWKETFHAREIFLRLDPEQSDGHHDHVKTAGSESKFGISIDQIPDILPVLKENDVRVVGLHAHCGSGIFDPETWSRHARFLSQFLPLFPELRYIDVGGGLGIPEQPNKPPLQLKEVNKHLAEFKSSHPNIALMMEPGRYLIAESGVILCRVTQLKTKREVTYVGVDCGMNTLIRPALYGSKHFITNLSRPVDIALLTEQRKPEQRDPELMRCNIVGPICESGDFLGRDRLLPKETSEGDVILIDTAGAYGRVMSSCYNLRDPAQEIWLGVGK